MDILKKLEIEFGIWEETNGEELRFCCPECSKKIHKSDTRFHLYVNLESLLFYCHRCKWKGHLSSVFKDINYGLKVFYQKKNKTKNPILDIGVDDYVSLDTESPCDMTQQAIRYLHNRHIYSIKQLFLGVVGKWFGRIIFPVYENGNFVFATARSIFDEKPRYRNTVGKKSHYIYRLNAVQNARSVVICEGCIDSLSIPNGIALFGKDLSERQYLMLRRVINKDIPIYVGLDGEARNEALQMCERFSAYWKKVFLLKIPVGEDLNSLHLSGKSRTIEQIPITPLSLVRLRCGGL